MCGSVPQVIDGGGDFWDFSLLTLVFPTASKRLDPTHNDLTGTSQEWLVATCSNHPKIATFSRVIRIYPECWWKIHHFQMIFPFKAARNNGTIHHFPCRLQPRQLLWRSGAPEVWRGLMNLNLGMSKAMKLASYGKLVVSWVIGVALVIILFTGIFHFRQPALGDITIETAWIHDWKDHKSPSKASKVEAPQTSVMCQRMPQKICPSGGWLLFWPPIRTGISGG